MCDRLILSRLRYCYYYTTSDWSILLLRVSFHCYCCCYFCNTDNTDASLLLSHPSTSTSTTTTSRFFWRLRKFHDILPWMRDFLLLQRRGFWSGLDWGCIIVKAVALALLLLAFTACKKGFVSLTMVVSSDATAAISLLWLWVAFMLLHRRAFTTTSGVNDSLIIDD